MVWKPHVTVAAVIEQDSRFLLVEEQTSNGLQFNQPAGHLEENEDLIDAVKREVTEETAWQFNPEALVAVQLWRKKPHHPSFLRFCFSGQVHSHDPQQALDDGIIATHWLSRDEIASRRQRLRSPLVLIGIDNYLSGQRHPLSMLQAFIDLTNE
ncbi:NUDIX hydrolase [Methylomarinum sp. Ch1-1]|uniref:Phosphatase NudJ n=1 Tax=Methylomarinum roseum TaxID=3067653 RepID=A0AAU7P024_9GAMM|nr:NUDIX hydrolase [Methylomarinum sp. Ch1-1]MDP4520182.1 NUDIX hydrolase [Methylomarinum sp. Ch1-1]